MVARCTIGMAMLLLLWIACSKRGSVMAGRVVPMRVGGVELLVETAPTAGTEQLAGKLDRAQATVAEAFDRAQSAIVAMAASAVDTIGRLGAQSAHPDEMTVTFGLKFSAQGHVIVAGVSGEATLEVSLTYRREAGQESGQRDGQPEAVGLTPRP